MQDLAEGLGRQVFISLQMITQLLLAFFQQNLLS